MANKIQKLKNSTNDTIYPVTVKDAIYDNSGNPLSIADTASVVAVDAKVGDLSLLTTTNKTSAVNAINEVDSDVTSLVNTVNGINSNINAVDNKIGLLSALETVDKTNVVGAINENFGHIGDLSMLTTTDKSNLVRATNELNSAIGQIGSDLATHKADIAYLKAPNRNILTVAKVGGQFETINDAIDYAKTYCTPSNRVTIQVGSGVYNEEIILYPNPGIDIIGSGSTVTSVQYPSVYPNSPIFTMGGGYFSNIGFISTAGGSSSYAFHFESQTDPVTGKIIFENCSFLSHTNSGIGIGMGQDTAIKFKACDIESLIYPPVYCHNFPSSNISNQNLELNSCILTSYVHDKCVSVDDAAKIAGHTNSVMYISFPNCQSNKPKINYRIDATTNLSYIPKTGSDIHLSENSKNTNILGCDVGLSNFTTGGIIAVTGNGLFSINMTDANKYDYIPYSASDEDGIDILSTVSFIATTEGYAVFSTSATSVQNKTININIGANAK